MIPLAPNSFKTFTLTKSSFSTKTRILLPCASVSLILSIPPKALINASKRGVDVRIITPGIPDKKLVFRVTRSYYQTLMKHGIRIYEYTPGFIHAKNFLVDDKCATVGTINLDYRSLYLHFENGIYIYKSKILKDIKEDFLKTEEVCHEVTLEEVITGKFMGWFEAILRVIAPLL